LVRYVSNFSSNTYTSLIIYADQPIFSDTF